MLQAASLLLVVCVIGSGWITPANAAEEPTAKVLSEALLHDNSDSVSLKDYLYVEETTHKTFDKDGHSKNTSSMTRELFWVDGTQLQRVLTINGVPPSADFLAKQEKTLDRQIYQLSSGQLDQRRASEKQIHEQQLLAQDVVSGFIFTLAGEEPCSGHTCAILKAEPILGFKGKSSFASLLPFLHGSILVDEQEKQWVRIDATPLKTVGGSMAYIGGESFIHMKRAPVERGIWALTDAQMRINARLLWDHKNEEVDHVYSHFRKFTVAVSVLPSKLDSQGAP